MSTSNVRPGHLLADRFELVEEDTHQLPFDDVSVWIARDTTLARQLRAIVLDPHGQHTAQVIDAARRAALIDDSSVVSIVSVIADGVDNAILTEVPPGIELSTLVDGTALDSSDVRAIIGQIAAIVNAARHRGVRHLAITANQVFLTNSGSVIVDGLGTTAALAGIDTTRNPAELDRNEARGLTLFLAALLLGESGFAFPEESTESLLSRAADTVHDDPHLHRLLTQEQEGSGASSPDELMRRLAPWGDISPALLSGSLSPSDTALSDNSLSGAPTQTSLASTSTEPVSDSESDGVSDVAGIGIADDSADSAEDAMPVINTTAAAAAAIDSFLGVDDDEGKLTHVAWPEITNIPAEATDEITPNDDTAPSNDVTPSDTAALTDSTASNDWDAIVHSPESEDDSAQVNDLPTVIPPRRVSFKSWREVTEESAVLPPSSEQEQATSPTQFIPPQAPTPQSSVTQTPTPTSQVSTPQAHTSEDHGSRNHGSQPSQHSGERRFNAGRIVPLFFIALIVILGFIAISKVFSPFDKVTLTPIDGNTPGVTASSNATQAPAQETPQNTATPEIKAIRLVSPESQDPEKQDNPDSVGNAIDGNPETLWKSYRYARANFNGTMSGIGLYVELVEPAPVSSVTLTANSQGGNIQWRDTVESAPSGGKIIQEGPIEVTTTLTNKDSTAVNGFVLWLTELPVSQADGKNRFELAEITVN